MLSAELDLKVELRNRFDFFKLKLERVLIWISLDELYDRVLLFDRNSNEYDIRFDFIVYFFLVGVAVFVVSESILKKMIMNLVFEII